jgi:hypothetical protein
MRRLSEYLVFVTGLVMLLGAIPHAVVGWPAMNAMLGTYGVDASTVGALTVGWYFGSSAMVALGVVAILACLEMRRGRGAARVYAAAAGACYLAFGLAAYLGRGFNPHFLFFVGLGAVLLAALGMWRPEVA